MLDTTTFIGLDVHARSIKAVSLDVMTGEVRAATFGYDAGAVAEWVRSVDPRARCVYESGVTGFDLQKRLSGLGVDCVVGAVSKMIKPSADRRRKNDRNDAEFLARMLSVGNVVERREALLARGVHGNKANVATARELACWVWAVGLMAEEA